MTSIDDLRRGLSAQQAKALTAFGESRGEPLRGLVAVMAVIDNRVHDGHWGTTVNDVVFADHQFSCWNASDLNCGPLVALGEAWLRGETPEDHDIVLATCLWLAGQTARYGDPSAGATHYCRAGLARMPAWTQPPAHRTLQIGAHIFFRDVP